MGIGSVTSMNNLSGMRMITANLTDSKSKNIQNEITNVRQQVQKLSSKEELSINEKTNERKKLQGKISNLNTELKQHQEELSKSQKREIRIAELQENKELTKEEKSEDKIAPKETSPDKADEKNFPGSELHAGQQGTVIAQNSDGTVILKEKMNQDEKLIADTEKKQTDEAKEEDLAEKSTKNIGNDAVTDTGLSGKKMHAIVSADSSVQQASRQGTIIARTRDGIAILKGEINQDEMRGVNTEKKQAELEKMEKQEQKAMIFQFSILGEANNTIKPTTAANVAGIKDDTQINAENNAFFNALRISQEGQASQQNLYISLGN